jgi:UDP-N-acetylmuramoyl-L-alanyl-D-glutamate--2,6-diaminopimelate ligase
MANKNDIIILAGKGHEMTQEINGEKTHYDEREIVKKLTNS